MSHFLRHFFFPHHTNNHRAKALHPDTLLVYVLMFSIFNLGIRIIHQQYPNVLGYATDIRVEQLLALTNQQRTEVGLQPLTMNATLSYAAAQKAADMFADNYWSHVSPKGKTPWEFIIASGYQYLLAGENLAKNFATSGGVVDAWMASPTHKDNIVKSGYKDVGFAVVNGVLNGEETTLVVQIFGATDGQKQIAALPTLTPKETGVLAQSPLALGQQTAQLLFGNEKSQTGKPSNIFSSAFSSVKFSPAINIPTVTRDVVFVFIGLLIGILVLDGIVVYKKRVVRVTGHTIAHILFLIGIGIALSMVQRGVLL